MHRVRDESHTLALNWSNDEWSVVTRNIVQFIVQFILDCGCCCCFFVCFLFHWIECESTVRQSNTSSQKKWANRKTKSATVTVNRPDEMYSQPTKKSYFHTAAYLLCVCVCLRTSALPLDRIMCRARSHPRKEEDGEKKNARTTNLMCQNSDRDYEKTKLTIKRVLSLHICVALFSLLLMTALLDPIDALYSLNSRIWSNPRKSLCSHLISIKHTEILIKTVYGFVRKLRM